MKKIHPEHITKSDRELIETLNYKKIQFPVSIKDVNKIETQNKIRINVFGCENKETFPVNVSKEKFDKEMNLLLINENENKHYVLIKDFNKFMFNHTKHNERKHFCMYCLQCFSSEEILTNHKENCMTINGKQAIKMPKAGEKIKFENFHKQLSCPYVIYTDFESLLPKIQGCKQPNEISYTESYQQHIDCSYGHKVVCCYDDKYSKPVQIYRGKNAAYKFLEKMLEEAKYCKKVMRKHFNKDMIMTKADRIDFKTATKCHICNKEYIKTDVKVRDHCHVTGKYRGSAHQSYNINYKLTDKIPVIFHNLKGYDSHFIMQNIGEIAKKYSYKNKKGEQIQQKKMSFQITWKNT